MSIIRSLKSLFSKLFIPKIIESTEPKHRKIKPKKKRRIHKKIKKHIKRIHHHVKRHVSIAKAKIKHRKTHKNFKHFHKDIPKTNEKKQPQQKRKEEKIQHGIQYGIPKHHKHEAELKVAEKTTDTEGEYAKNDEGKKVQLRIQEKTSGEIAESGKPKHTFFFRLSKNREKQSDQKKQEKIKRKKNGEEYTQEIKICEAGSSF